MPSAEIVAARWRLAVSRASRKVVYLEQNAYACMMGETLFLIEILSWDWPLHVGVRPRSAIADPDSEGDLLCAQSVAIEGRVLAPEEHRSKLIHIRLYPFPREIISGDGDERCVGRLRKDPAARSDLAFDANLFLPADTLQSVIVCLGSIWRRVHMWVDGNDEAAAVTDFAFSVDSEVKPGLRVDES